MSAIARAIRPLPSSNGWIVTNHRCACAALSTGSIAVSPLNQSRNCRISSSSRVAAGRFEMYPLAPDRSGDDLHRRRAVVAPCADTDRVHPAAPGGEERRVPGKQPVRRSGAGRSAAWRRASSRRHPRRDGRPASDRRCLCRDDERAMTGPGQVPASRPRSRCVLRTSSVSVRRTASSRTLKPSASIWPPRRPCLCLASANGAARRSASQENRGQSASSCIYGTIHRNICGHYSSYSPACAYIDRIYCGD